MSEPAGGDAAASLARGAPALLLRVGADRTILEVTGDEPAAMTFLGSPAVGDHVHRAMRARARDLVDALEWAFSGVAADWVELAAPRPLAAVVRPVFDELGLVAAVNAVITVVPQPLASGALASGDTGLVDTVTGLAGHRLAVDRIGRLLARAARATAPVSVLHVELDGLREVGAAYGAAVGDAIAREAAGRLAEVTRGEDELARVAPTGFVVATVAAPEVAEVLRRRVSAALEQRYDADGRDHHLGVTMGIAAALPGSGVGPEQLLSDAELAMHSVRPGGQANALVFDAAMRTRIAERLDIERSLRTALDNAEFRLVFQPIVTLADGRAVAFEALLRWEHPHRGVISPLDFVPVAERTGEIVRIGAWVMREACDVAVRVSREAGRDIGVSVNVSARQCSNRLVELVHESLRASGLAPRLLSLELTETAMLATQVDGVLQAVTGEGVGVALDDFGTGYSSLSHLQRVRAVNTLKIDRRFVEGVDAAEQRDQLPGAIVAMAAVLGLETVAEGVETEAQARTLVGLGCRLAQGYHFSRPVPEAELLAYCRR